MKFLIALTILHLLAAFQSVAAPNIVLIMVDDHGYGDCGYFLYSFERESQRL